MGEVGTNEVAKAHTKSIHISMGTELHLQIFKSRCRQHPSICAPCTGQGGGLTRFQDANGRTSSLRDHAEQTNGCNIQSGPLMIIHQQYFPVHV